MKNLNINCLSAELNGIFKINEGQLYYNVFINKKNSDSLFIFFQGAVDKDKPQPNFQRISWSKSIQENLLIFADPSIDGNALTIGWSQHSPKVNYFYRLANMIKKYAEIINVKEDRILLYGSSAGGFTALMVAAYFNNVKVVVNNPQTDWTKFYKNKVDEVLNTIYDGISLHDYKSTFPNRFDVGAIYKNIGRIPSIVYMQNIDDDFHYENHFKPFSNIIYENKLKVSNFHSIIYSSPLDGHNPCSMEDTLKIINMVSK